MEQDWVQLVVRLWRRVRGRNESVHHRLKEALPAGPVETVDAREQLREAVGTLEELAAALEPRIRERGTKIMRRNFGDASTEANEVARRVFARWDEADGLVPKLRAELPEESRRFPVQAEKFVKEWNESTWLHKFGHGKLRVENLEAGPFMSGWEFVDWNLDHWAWELEQSLSLHFGDVALLPLFFVAFLGAALNNWFDMPGWLAVVTALALAVPSLYGWRWLRRRGYVTWEGD